MNALSEQVGLKSDEEEESSDHTEESSDHTEESTDYTEESSDEEEESTDYTEIVEERYKFVNVLYLISKASTSMTLFAKPPFIKKHFGCFLRKVQLYSNIATLRGHSNTVVRFAIHENKLYSASSDRTIRIWNTEHLTNVLRL